MIRRSQMGSTGQGRVKCHVLVLFSERTHRLGAWRDMPLYYSYLPCFLPSPTLPSFPECSQTDQEASTVHLTSVRCQPGPADSYPNLAQLPRGLHQLTLYLSGGLLRSPLYQHYEVQTASNPPNYQTLFESLSFQKCRSPPQFLPRTASTASHTVSQAPPHSPRTPETF